MHILLIHPEKRAAQCIRQGLKYENITCDVIGHIEHAYQTVIFMSFDAVVVSSAALQETPQTTRALERLLRARERLCIVLFGKESVMFQETIATKKHHLIQMNDTASIQEIAYRLKGFLYKKRLNAKQVIRFKDIKLDLIRREVWRNGKKVPLRNKEFSLLEYFLMNPGNVLTRPMILEHVWDRNANIMTNTIDVHVASLRKKLERSAQEERLKTVHGVGYKLA